MNKIVFLDYLRFVAIIGVVMIHCTPIGGMDFNSYAWKYNLPFNVFSRFCVPLFFMISGALFLNPDKNTDFAYLIRKIVRIIIVFFLFSLFYDLLWYFNKYDFSFNKDALLNVFIPNLLTGKFHLWYLAALIPLYLLTPIFKVVVGEVRVVRYYILLSFFVCCVIPFSYNLLKLSGDYSFLEKVTDNMAFNLPAYSLYFVLGFHLSNISLERFKSKKKMLWGGAFLLYFFMIFGDFALSYVLEVPSVICSGYLSPLTVVYSSVIFVIVRILIGENLLNTFVYLIAKFSLGIYLIHVLFVDILNSIGFLPVRMLPAIMIPTIVIIVMFLSIGATYIMKKIPFLNRLL